MVLNFQLCKHEKYLKKFSLLFRQIDADTDGVITDAEFLSLASRMQIPTGEPTEKLLRAADPNGGKRVTFSECVALFSSVK